MPAFTVTNVSKPFAPAPAVVANTADLLKARRNSPVAMKSSQFSLSAIVPLTPRTDIDLKVQRQFLEAKKQQSLDRFVCEHKGLVSHPSVHHETAAAKMLVREGVRYQKANGSALLEHTLRPHVHPKGLIPGCHASTVKLMLLDVDIIMRKHHKAGNGYTTIKRSLSRIPLWSIPTSAGALI